MAPYCKTCQCQSSPEVYPCEDRQAVLDQEAAFYQARILELLSHYNALAPVSKLPAEILSAIFLRCLESRKIVTWVCHAWRSAALECLSLWTQVDIRPGLKKDELEVLLSRSRSLPLAVSYIGFEDYIDKSSHLLAALRHPEKIQRLYLREWGLYFSNAKLIFSLGARNMQRLEVVCIASARDIVVLPKEFLSASAPALTTLELSGFDFNPLLTSPILDSAACNMTIFRLEGDMRRSIRVGSLAKALQKMNKLEVLALSNVLSDYKDTVDRSSKEDLSRYTIELPNLRILAISQQYLLGDHVLPILRYPLSTSVDLSFEAVHRIESMARLSYAFSNHIRLWNEHSGLVSSWHIGFSLSEHTLLLNIRIPGANVFTITLDRYSRQKAMISSLYKALPWNYVTSVTHKGMACLEYGGYLPWWTSMRHFEWLQSLCLTSAVRQKTSPEDSDDGPLCETPRLPSVARNSIPNPFFSEISPDSLPHLSHLSIRSYMFNENAIEDLCSWLTARSALGLGLSQLDMADCEISKAGLNMVRDIVKTVLLDDDCEVVES